MKVICAGMSKTGTKSLQVALRELGFNVYDYIENYVHLGNDWLKIIAEGGSTEDFRRMFENVDAVTDIPGCYYWDEIHKAFPDSKIIFTIRDEESWVRSMRNQLKASSNPFLILMYMLSPTFARLRNYGRQLIYPIFGTVGIEHLFKPIEFNMLLARMNYRRHNAHVLQNAPKDKLLMYNVKEGWEPLCNFLGVQIPSTPFPHKNARGNIIQEWMDKEPLFIRGKREVATSLSILLLLASYGIYRILRSFPSK